MAWGCHPIADEGVRSLHFVYDLPDADSVHDQYDRVIDAFRRSSRGSPINSMRPEWICSCSPRFRSRSGVRSGPTIPGEIQQGDPAADRCRRIFTPPAFGSTAQSLPRGTTNVSKPAVISVSTCWPAPADPHTIRTGREVTPAVLTATPDGESHDDVVYHPTGLDLVARSRLVKTSTPKSCTAGFG